MNSAEMRGKRPREHRDTAEAEEGPTREETARGSSGVHSAGHP